MEDGGGIESVLLLSPGEKDVWNSAHALPSAEC